MWLKTRVFHGFEKCQKTVSQVLNEFSYVLRAIQKNLKVFWSVATIVCVYKGISRKCKGKYAVGPFSLLFLTGKSNQNNTFSGMLPSFAVSKETHIGNLWCYIAHIVLFGHMTIFSSYDNLAILYIWHQKGCLLKHQ